MGHLNVEIKARCAHPEHVRRILSERGADRKGVDRQCDTYFCVPNGRLKLREGNIERSLIHYDREEKPGPKRSHVSLYRPNEGIGALKETLERALGVKVVVDKKREIAFIDNVKFHLDEVNGLGSFVEIEAIDYDGTVGEDRLFAQCRHYLELFGVAESDLITSSYSDMLLNSHPPVFNPRPSVMKIPLEE